MKTVNLLLTGFLALLILSCKSGLEGNLNENQPPHTGMAVKEINRSGNDRLSSQIKISWWGDDPDGYVIGYEYAINDTINGWHYTTKTDSVFVLPIPTGNDSADVVFHVRAVDNENLRDPVGAKLVYPIKNSPPYIEFNKTEIPPDTLFEIASFGWTVSDIDGQTNLAYTEIALNDTNISWTKIPVDMNFISVKVENPGDPNSKSRIYSGRSYQQTNYEISGLKLNAKNKLYIRAVDNAGAVSRVDTVSWYAKKRKSDILFINDYEGSNSKVIARFHLSRMDSVGLSNVDYWDISDGVAGGGRKVTKSQAFPTVNDPTLIKTLAEWKHIYWVSNNMDRNITYAPEISREFFDNGGTMFIDIPSKYLDDSDPIFNFLPLDGITPLPQNATNFLVPQDRQVLPVTGISGPVLDINQTISSRYPVKAASGSTPLYKTDFIIRTLTGYEDFTGNEVVAVKNKENNLIYFGLDMYDLNESNNIDQLIRKMCKEELGF